MRESIHHGSQNMFASELNFIQDLVIYCFFLIYLLLMPGDYVAKGMCSLRDASTWLTSAL